MGSLWPPSLGAALQAGRHLGWVSVLALTVWGGAGAADTVCSHLTGGPATAWDILGAFLLSSLAHHERSSNLQCIFKPRTASGSRSK